MLYLQLEMSLICSRDEQDGFLAVSSFFSGDRGSFVVALSAFEDTFVTETL